MTNDLTHERDAANYLANYQSVHSFAIPVVSPYKLSSMDSATAIAVLTAMITPAVLISACASMILSTSSRLGRVVDRVRSLADRLEELHLRSDRGDSAMERQAAIFEQLDK